MLTSALAAVATTAAAAGKRRQDSGGSPGKNGARAVGSSRSGSGSGGGAGSINAPSISGEPSDTPTRRGHHPGKSPPDRTENDTAATAADGARGMVRPAVFGGPATASVPMPTARMAAVRARAEELAAAKFAGMRSAAKAKDDVHAAAGGAGAGPSAPSFDQGQSVERVCEAKILEHGVLYHREVAVVARSGAQRRRTVKPYSGAIEMLPSHVRWGVVSFRGHVVFVCSLRLGRGAWPYGSSARHVGLMFPKTPPPPGLLPPN